MIRPGMLFKRPGFFIIRDFMNHYESSILCEFKHNIYNYICHANVLSERSPFKEVLLPSVEERLFFGTRRIPRLEKYAYGAET